MNPALELEGVLLTMYDSRLNLSTQIVGEVQKFFAGKAYATIVRRNVRWPKRPATASPSSLTTFSTGAKEYLSLAKEFLVRN